MKIVFLKNPLWKHKSSMFLNKHHCYYYAEVTYTRKSQTYWFGNIKIWIVNFILSYHCFIYRPHLLHWATTESQSCIFFLYRLRQRFVNSELLNGVVCFLASFYFYFFFSHENYFLINTTVLYILNTMWIYICGTTTEKKESIKMSFIYIFYL